MRTNKNYLISEADQLYKIANWFDENFYNEESPFDMDDLFEIADKYKAMSEIEDMLEDLQNIFKDRKEHSEAMGDKKAVEIYNDILKNSIITQAMNK